MKSLIFFLLPAFHLSDASAVLHKRKSHRQRNAPTTGKGYGHPHPWLKQYHLQVWLNRSERMFFVFRLRKQYMDGTCHLLGIPERKPASPEGKRNDISIETRSHLLEKKWKSREDVSMDDKIPWNMTYLVSLPGKNRTSRRHWKDYRELT